MELRHLRRFIAVAEEPHFARAAERLHIEQSGLSRTIKELEKDLGEQLFIRSSRRTYLLELTSTEKSWMASVSWDYPTAKLSMRRR